MNDWLVPGKIVYWGHSSERYSVVCVVMTGAGPAAWIQSMASGVFISVQPDEVEAGDLSPTPQP